MTTQPRPICPRMGASWPAKVFRVDIATGRRALWKKLMPGDVTGVVGLGSFVITPDGRSYAYSYSRNLSDLYVVDGVK